MNTGWRRAAQLTAVTLSVQVLLAGVVFSRGFPYYGSRLIDGAALWEWPVAAFHLPAIETLTSMGLCCGFSNGLVLSHRVVGGHIPMHLTGTFVLAATNWICWTAIALLAQLAFILVRSRRRVAAGPPGGELS